MARRVARAGARQRMTASRTELLIATIARLLEGCRSVVIGNRSPIPGSAALLARELSGGALRLTILGSRRFSDFTNGGVETFDRAAQGRIDRKSTRLNSSHL